MTHLLAAVRNLAVATATDAPGAYWYVFGSYLSAPSSANDLDILVVCSDVRHFPIVRSAIDSAEIQFPVHFLILHQDEESELEFVERQRAVRIYPHCFQRAQRHPSSFCESSTLSHMLVHIERQHSAGH